jgi:hypothetical protein
MILRLYLVRHSSHSRASLSRIFYENAKGSKHPSKKGKDNQPDQHDRDAQDYKQPEKERFGVFGFAERYLMASVDVIV